HGARFQLIDAVVAASPRGLVARARGSLARGWGSELAVDVGALDAALQAMLVWCRHVTGAAFLPTAIAHIDAEPARDERALVCVVHGATCDGLRARADIVLCDEQGRCCARLDGVEMHRLPDDGAFRNNRAAPFAAAPPGTERAT